MVYQFQVRLIYHISSAPEIFHKTMAEMVGDIEGICIYIDDILIFSETLEGHNKILETVLERARI